MSHYVKNNGEFVQGSPVFRECPHCGKHAQLIAVSTPAYDELAAARPEQVALGFRCSACNEARFARARVRAITPEHVELSPNLVEIERAAERFSYTHLPESVSDAFREALACHTAQCNTAFGLMCRVTLDASSALMASNHPGRLRRAYHDAIRIGGVDASVAHKLQSLLFDEQHTPALLAEHEAAVLVEIMKDMLYECHVRGTRLRAALRMRRYFADEARAREHMHGDEPDNAAVA